MTTLSPNNTDVNKKISFQIGQKTNKFRKVSMSITFVSVLKGNFPIRPRNNKRGSRSRRNLNVTYKTGEIALSIMPGWWRIRQPTVLQTTTAKTRRKCFDTRPAILGHAACRLGLTPIDTYSIGNLSVGGGKVDQVGNFKV